MGDRSPRCNATWNDPDEDGLCMCNKAAGHQKSHVCACGSRMRVMIDRGDDD